MSFSEFFNHFTEYYGIVHSLFFRRIPLSQLAYFQFSVISNKEKFALALVINIIFPVIYFYDDNPLLTLKDTSEFIRTPPPLRMASFCTRGVGFLNQRSRQNEPFGNFFQMFRQKMNPSDFFLQRVPPKL